MARKKSKPRVGQGSALSRSELKLIRGALYNDWPIPSRQKAAILKQVIDIIVPKKGTLPAKTRNIIMAARTIAAFSGLTLRQQALDLRREKQEGKTSDLSLADLVGEAEQRAEQRKNERDASK